MIVANRNTLSRLKSVGLSRLFLCGPPVGCRLYLSFRYILAAAAAMTTTTSPTTNSNGLRREKWQNCIYPAFNGHSLFRSQPPNIRQRQCWPSSSTHIQSVSGFCLYFIICSMLAAQCESKAIAAKNYGDLLLDKTESLSHSRNCSRRCVHSHSLCLFISLRFHVMLRYKYLSGDRIDSQ